MFKRLAFWKKPEPKALEPEPEALDQAALDRVLGAGAGRPTSAGHGDRKKKLSARERRRRRIRRAMSKASRKINRSR